ncbi:MAG TPA: HipA domain-containing protein [Candidatus Elarobacter sp.]|nr:HipA domain-containing protein [Candidatus Elarobacter sp.]
MTTPVLRVALAFSPDHQVPVGRLALDGNVVVFEYDAAFAESGLSLNPAFGTIGPGLLHPRDPRAFRGLHGVFADSLPDAWGDLLVERRLRRAGVATSSLTVLDRLALVGRRGRGALVYEPADDGAAAAIAGEIDLNRLAHEAGEVLEGHESAVLHELERLGGSSGGARPKVQVALDDAGRAREDGGEPLPPGFTSWIVKFRGNLDRVDIGSLEAAYAEAARRAGIDMPRTRLISAQTGPGYFATERFDRKPDNGRIHMLSIAGMLDADWTLPSIDYEAVLDAVRGATRDDRAVVQMYRRMVFNVLAQPRRSHQAARPSSRRRWCVAALARIRPHVCLRAWKRTLLGGQRAWSRRGAARSSCGWRGTVHQSAAGRRHHRRRSRHRRESALDLKRFRRDAHDANRAEKSASATAFAHCGFGTFKQLIPPH